MIISFGYKHGPVLRADKTFDVRDVTHDTTSQPFNDRLNEISEYARAHPQERIAIGCEKGQHRSRVMANTVATLVRTSVLHRDK